MGATETKSNAATEFSKLSKLSSDIAGKVDESKMKELQFQEWLSGIGNDCEDEQWWVLIGTWLKNHSKQLYASYCKLLRTNSLTIGLGNEFFCLDDLHIIFTGYLQRKVEQCNANQVPQRRRLLGELIHQAAGFSRVIARLQECVRQFKSKENHQEPIQKVASCIDMGSGHSDYQQLSDEAYGLLRSLAAATVPNKYSKVAAKSPMQPNFKHHKRLSMFLRKFSADTSTIKTRKAALRRLFEHIDELQGKHQRQVLLQLLTEHANRQQCYIDAYLLAELGSQDAWRLRIAFECLNS